MQQRLKGGPVPELPGGVMGIGDPEHGTGRAARREILGRGTEMQRQIHWSQRCRPAVQSPEVISKSGRIHHTQAGISCISRSPGEQFSSTIASDHPLRGQPMTGPDQLTKRPAGRIGIISPGPCMQSAQQGSRQRPWTQGGTGIKKIPGAATERLCNGCIVAAMLKLSIHLITKAKRETSTIPIKSQEAQTLLEEAKSIAKTIKQLPNLLGSKQTLSALQDQFNLWIPDQPKSRPSPCRPWKSSDACPPSARQLADPCLLLISINRSRLTSTLC